MIYQERMKHEVATYIGVDPYMLYDLPFVVWAPIASAWFNGHKDEAKHLVLLAIAGV